MIGVITNSNFLSLWLPVKNLVDLWVAYVDHEVESPL